MATYASLSPPFHQDISIHATHTGGDGRGLSCHVRQIDFNPRHPYGWRPIPGFCVVCGKGFQSTPPIRVATVPSSMEYGIRGISIHATHTGGDWSWPARSQTSIDFNPRHPYGWRHLRSRYRIWRGLFQSTPPIRVATKPFYPGFFPL